MCLILRNLREITLQPIFKLEYNDNQLYFPISRKFLSFFILFYPFLSFFILFLSLPKFNPCRSLSHNHGIILEKVCRLGFLPQQKILLKNQVVCNFCTEKLLCNVNLLIRVCRKNRSFSANSYCKRFYTKYM